MQQLRLTSVQMLMRSTAVALVALAAFTVGCGARPPTSSVPLLSTAAASSEASPSPAGGALQGQLAYVAGEPNQIHLLDLATGDSRQLTELTEDHGNLTSRGPLAPVITCGFGIASLAWSPDGTRLAFSFGGCDAVVYVVELDGTLTRIADGRGPAWSPDGRLLAFSPNAPFCMGADCGPPPHPGAWNLQVVELDHGGPPAPMMVDDATSGASQPTWSPDGRLIAFSASIQDRSANPDLLAAAYVAQADGSGARLLLQGAWPAGWLPDGRLLLVDERTGVVGAFDFETADVATLGGALGPALVAPDGTRILMSVTDPVSGLSGARLATVEGDVLVERAGWPGAWAPNGSAAAVIDLEEAGGIVVLDRDGAELRIYPLDPAVNAHHLVAWQPDS